MAKKGVKLTKKQIEQIDEKVQETIKKRRLKEKTPSKKRGLKEKTHSSGKTSSRRKLNFMVLTILGIIFTTYFFVIENLILIIIGILFSIVAAYNVTCEEK